MKLVIEDVRGVWHAKLDGRSEFGDTLEELLLKLAPEAPESQVWATCDVLGGILGAEVVELQPQEIEMPFEDFLAFLEADHEPEPDEYPRGV